MSYLPINSDPSSTNARIQALEVQLVDSGEMNADLRDSYLYIFNSRVKGIDVERDLVELETELRKRSVDSRLEVEQFVQHLYRNFGIANDRLPQHLPMFPDSVDANGRLHWDFRLETPLRWADQGMPAGVLTHYNRWVPPTNWLPPQRTEFNVGAAPFVPQGSNNAVQASHPNVSSSNELVERSELQAFHPSRVLLGQPRLLSSHFLHLARSMGFEFNPNYEGGIDEFTVQNASCPEDYNCSLFITNVHPDSSTAEFFDQIREGAVFSYHRKLPTGGINTCAISLVFKTREAAVAFFNRSTRHGIWIRMLRLKVSWNRERVWPSAFREDSYQTRVLRITGPLNQASLGPMLNYLSTVVNFTVTHTRAWVDDRRLQNFEVGFGSVRGQSRNAMKALAVHLGQQWRVVYAPDPCGQWGR